VAQGQTGRAAEKRNPARPAEPASRTEQEDIFRRTIEQHIPKA